MRSTIDELDDGKAIWVLTTVAKARSGSGLSETDASMRPTIDWPTSEAARLSGQVAEGDLARATLRWLSEDARQRQVLEDLATGEAPTSYGVGLGIGAVIAVLLILKTKGMVEYKNDRWRFKIELTEVKEGPLKTVLDLLKRLSG